MRAVKKQAVASPSSSQGQQESGYGIPVTFQGATYYLVPQNVARMQQNQGLSPPTYPAAREDTTERQDVDPKAQTRSASDDLKAQALQSSQPTLSATEIPKAQEAKPAATDLSEPANSTAQAVQSPQQPPSTVKNQNGPPEVEVKAQLQEPQVTPVTPQPGDPQAKKKRPKIVISKPPEPESQSTKKATKKPKIVIGSAAQQTNNLSATKEPSVSQLKEQIQNLQMELDEETKKVEKLKTENKDLKGELKLHQEMKQHDIDIAFVYASPLYVQWSPNLKGSSTDPWALLKFNIESDGIKKSIKASKQNTKFMQTLGTMENFKKVVSLRPYVLHLSCHGEYDIKDRSKGLLIFEQDNGEGIVIKQDDLLNQKESLKHIKLVFIAACKSDRIGKMLQSAGVSHVICSKNDVSLVDETTVRFTQSLYTKIFKGESICQAFKEAKDEVSKCQGDQEVEMYNLITHNQHPRSECSTFRKGEKGTMACMSEHIKFKSIYSMKKNYIERENDQFKQLLNKILDANERKICFYGYAGLGKTYIVTNMLHYICERKFFLGGVMYLNLNQQYQIEWLWKSLFQEALKFFKLTKDQQKTIRQETNNKDYIISFLIDFINQRYGKEDNSGEYKLKDKKQHYEEEEERGKSFLLVLDNCQEIIDKQIKEFKELLDRFENKCNHLTILVVTRDKLSDFSAVRLQNIKKIRQSIDFFEYKIERGPKNDHINLDDEAVDLISSTPFEDMEINQSEKNIVTSKENLRNYIKEHGQRKRLALLEKHPLFKYLCGNPTSLIQAANCYLHEIIDRREVGKLKSIYELMKSCLARFTNLKDVKNVLDQNPKKRNDFSLEVATRMTLDMIPNDDTDAKNLLYFLGCLPGGISEENIKNMWVRDAQNQNQSMHILKDLHLIQEEEKSDRQIRYKLENLIREFTQQDLSDETKDQFMGIIIDFFTTELKTEYDRMAEKRDNEVDDENSDEDNGRIAHRLSLIQPDKDLLQQINRQAHDDLLHLKSKSIALEDEQDDFMHVMDEGFNTNIIQERANLFYCMEYILEKKDVTLDFKRAAHLEHFNNPKKASPRTSITATSLTNLQQNEPNFLKSSMKPSSRGVSPSAHDNRRKTVMSPSKVDKGVSFEDQKVVSQNKTSSQMPTYKKKMTEFHRPTPKRMDVDDDLSASDEETKEVVNPLKVGSLARNQQPLSLQYSSESNQELSQQPAIQIGTLESEVKEKPIVKQVTKLGQQKIEKPNIINVGELDVEKTDMPNIMNVSRLDSDQPVAPNIVAVGRLDSEADEKPNIMAVSRLDSEAQATPPNFMSVGRLDSETEPQPKIQSVGRLGSEQQATTPNPRVQQLDTVESSDACSSRERRGSIKKPSSFNHLDKQSSLEEPMVQAVHVTPDKEAGGLGKNKKFGVKKAKKAKKKFVSEAPKIKESLKLELFQPKSFHAKNIPKEAKNRVMAHYDNLVDEPILMAEMDQFIIYCIALFFITGRYSDAFRICSQMFNRQGYFFRCNKLRFMCLSAESAFIQLSELLDQTSTQEIKNRQMVNCFLFDAVIASRKNQSILDEDEVQNCYHQSRGLCALQIGLLFMRHAETLAKPTFQSQWAGYLEQPQTVDRLKGFQIDKKLGSEQECRRYAREQLKKAYAELQKINDLRAMQIVKSQELKLLQSEDFKRENGGERIDELNAETTAVEEEIQRIKEECERKSTSQRKFRDEISLLSQVLLNDQTKPVYQ